MYPFEEHPKGHTWKTVTYKLCDGSEEQDIDIFAYEYGDYHNGPRCVVCGYGFCHHCIKEPAVECPGDLMTQE